jgi:D-alanyl-D-alanine carboxypeptidase (penicillin-binding protein 5/6)/beta-lactamase class A
MKRLFILLAVVAFGCRPGPAEEQTLEKRLAPLAKAHEGKVAIAVKHLGTGETYFLNADTKMGTASLIKIPVLIEFYQQVKEGKVKPATMVTLKKEDKVPGSGILTRHFTSGATFSLRDAARLMMAFSDNTATNIILDHIGLRATAKRMEDWGYPNTKVYAKVFRAATTSFDKEMSNKYGLGSTTAREMLGILEKLQQGKLVSAKACKVMLGHMKTCEDKHYFPRFLPEKTVVAHKTGSTSTIRTDGGIIFLPDKTAVALVVLTNDNKDHSWRRDNAAVMLCAKVAREVYAHFTKDKRTAKGK